MAVDLYAKLTFVALIAMMVLPIIIVVRMGKIRDVHIKQLITEGRKDELKRLALDDRGWPDAIIQFQNSYKSQFELPVIFYALTVLSLALGKADLIMCIICALFVACRFGHAYVHTTSNYIPHRFNLYLASLISVVAQMIYLSIVVLGA